MLNKYQLHFFTEHIKEAQEKKKKKKGLNKMQQAALLGGGAAMVGLGGLGYALRKGAKETNQIASGVQDSISRANKSTQAYNDTLSKARETDRIIANETRQAFKDIPDLSDSSGFEAVQDSINRSNMNVDRAREVLDNMKTSRKSATEKLQEIAENAEFGLPKAKNPLDGFETTKLESPSFKVREEVPSPKAPSLGKPLSLDEYDQKFMDLGAKAGVPPEDVQTVYANAVKYAKGQSSKNPEKIVQRIYDDISKQNERGLRFYNRFLLGPE